MIQCRLAQYSTRHHCESRIAAIPIVTGEFCKWLMRLSCCEVIAQLFLYRFTGPGWQRIVAPPCPNRIFRESQGLGARRSGPPEMMGPSLRCVQRGMSATGKSRHSGNRAPLGHHDIRYPYTACGPTCGALSGHPTPGAWGYRGGYAGGYRIPQPERKFPRKYNALADRSPGRINPDSPLGAPPLGLPISPSVADSIFRRFNVPSQIATHHSPPRGRER